VGGVTDHGDLTGRDAADQHPADAITVADSGGYFVGTDVEAVLAELGSGMRGWQDHGSAGATEDVSFITGHHRIVLSADLTIDFTGAVSGDSYWTVVDFVGDGTPRTVGYTGSTVTWVGDALDHSGTLDEVVTVVYRTTDGGTNVIAAVSGAGGGSIAIDDGSTTVDPVTDLSVTGAGLVDVSVTDDGGGAATLTITATASDPVDDTHAWMPLTSVVSGDPVLVWDGDDNLIPTLTPL
jgi:hypothetical protein